MFEIGGIYRAVSTMANIPAALVVVLGASKETGSLEVALLSPDVEFGTNIDMRLAGNEVGLAYDLLVHSDIFGHVWAEQIQPNRKLGMVSAEVLVALSCIRNDDETNRPVAGPPLIGRADPRWNFKLRELRRLQVLTADCTRYLIDGAN